MANLCEEMFGTYFDVDNCKSYATKENLAKALKKMGITRADGRQYFLFRSVVAT